MSAFASHRYFAFWIVLKLPVQSSRMIKKPIATTGGAMDPYNAHLTWTIYFNMDACPSRYFIFYKVYVCLCKWQIFRFLNSLPIYSSTFADDEEATSILLKTKLRISSPFPATSILQKPRLRVSSLFHQMRISLTQVQGQFCLVKKFQQILQINIWTVQSYSNISQSARQCKNI